jgi:CheY-like chemotaxis protein
MKKEVLAILLADDDEGDRLLFKEAFSELKIKTVVDTVNDGMQLMELLMKEDRPLPDFIFLDLNMPRKNGMECLREIRNIEKLKDVFIAIYSTSDNEKDMEETFLHGANVYITKPDDFNTLKLLLHKVAASALIYAGDSFNKKNFLLKI